MKFFVVFFFLYFIHLLSRSWCFPEHTAFVSFIAGGTFIRRCNSYLLPNNTALFMIYVLSYYWTAGQSHGFNCGVIWLIITLGKERQFTAVDMLVKRGPDSLPPPVSFCRLSVLCFYNMFLHCVMQYTVCYGTRHLSLDLLVFLLCTEESRMRNRTLFLHSLMMHFVLFIVYLSINRYGYGNQISRGFDSLSISVHVNWDFHVTFYFCTCCELYIWLSVFKSAVILWHGFAF